MKITRENNGCTVNVGFPYMLLACITGMVGYHIHHSLGWAIIDGIFSPFAWLKWLVCQEISITIIKETFAFLFK